MISHKPEPNDSQTYKTYKDSQGKVTYRFSPKPKDNKNDGKR